MGSFKTFVISFKVIIDETLTASVTLEHGSRVSVTFIQNTINKNTNLPVSFGLCTIIIDVLVYVPHSVRVNI